jgi:GNAT superfamily N-acetyltransferase
MTEWRIDPLGSHHIRSNFSCGVASLDDFFRTQVTQYERRGLGRSYVATEHSGMPVVGYYTLATSSIKAQNLAPEAARRLPRHPIPVVLLARLAVDQSHQKTGIGARLLKDAITRTHRVAQEIGAFAIHVEAVDDRAAAFYRKFGFVSFPAKPLELYLPLATLIK